MAETAGANAHDRIVSCDAEALILVDSDDREIGYLDKAACHDGAGRLHRAFSVFVFNSSGRLLLQQRSAAKRLWPLAWANSCCSHPRRGEDVHDAAQRRLAEELGISCDPEFLYKFEYQAAYRDLGSEHELCWVFAARSDARLKPNRHELADWRWVDASDLDRELAAGEVEFTPWLQLEWRQLRAEFAELFQSSNW